MKIKKKDDIKGALQDLHRAERSLSYASTDIGYALPYIKNKKDRKWLRQIELDTTAYSAFLARVIILAQHKYKIKV